MKKEKKADRATGDMTTGSVWKKLVVFAIPILLGSLLQQLYNAVDGVIVGQFVGVDALGAVSQTGPIVQLLIALFMGLSSGACVVVANYFGKKDKENLSKTVHTAMILAVISGAVLSIIGVFAARPLLHIIGTPANMIDDAAAYLQIFFAGMVGLAIYNMGASILQAVGNSRYPLYFLAVTTVLNTIGDLLFVAVFDMGVAGAALATIIAEFVSAILILVVLMRSKREYKLSFKKLKIDTKIMKRIVAIGLPSAIQQSIVSVSNIFVQSYISKLDVAQPGVIAGYGAESKLDAFLPLPISAMSLAVTTFVSQNLGAGEIKRAKKGVWTAVLIGTGATLFLSILAMLFHNAIFSVFSTAPEVLDYGWQFAMVIVPGYLLLFGTSIIPGALRGAGRVKVATIVPIISFVVIRQIYLFTIEQTMGNTIFTVALSYPATWAICAGTMLTYYLVRGISGEGFVRVRTVRTDGTNVDFIGLCQKLDEFQNANVPGRQEAGLNSMYNIENLKDIFLLYDGDTAIGSAALWAHDDKTCEIIRAYIDPNKRGMGHEKVLISEVEQFAKSLGYQKIIFRTFNSLSADIAAYTDLGFLSANADDFQYVDRYPQAMSLAPQRVYMERALN